MTRPEKIGPYIKHTYLYYDTYLLFCMGYGKFVCFIASFMASCICDKMFVIKLIKSKELLHFKVGQSLCVDKTGFLRPDYIKLLYRVYTELFMEYYMLYLYIQHTHIHNIQDIERLLTLYSNISILCIIVHYISSYTLVYSCVIDHSITDY